MSVILDLLISIIFGGILTLLVLNSKDVAHESLQETHAGMLVQEELTSVIQELEGEFRNAGSGVPATVAPVVRAESTAITFLADLDGDRSAADTVSYELGKTDEMLGTPNPVDRPLYRTVNSQRLLNGSLTVLLFRYFDVGGSQIPSPVPNHRLAEIHTVEVTAETQNSMGFNNQSGQQLYPASMWQQTRLASRNYRR